MIPDLLRQRAALSSERVALRELTPDAQLTYRQLDRNAASCAGLLAARGVAAGERVAVLCRNRIEFFELLFGCARLGAILVPLNWRMPASELAPLLADSAPRVLFYGDADAPVAAELARDGLPAIGFDDGAYASERDEASPIVGRALWPPDDCWYLLYTSGTTGQPKAVIQTFRMAVANYVNIGQAMGITGDDVTLNFLPLFHTAGINLLTLPTMIAGGETIVLPGFDSERTIGLLAEGAIDTFFAVPAVYQQLALDARFDSLDLGRVRSFGCGGAPMPDELCRRYLERGARVCNGMGMTETGPTVFLMDAAGVASKIGSVGKPQVLSAVRIVDGGGRDVATGATGELLFAGPNVTPGYWRRPEATAAAFTADGWLRSGDLARRDDDGYYYIVGRIKDMYISGGENVYPAEVENVLASHAAILEAAVIGIADERWGEVGCAFVLPRPGCELPDTETLRGWCRSRLAGYKVPRRFVTVEDFPRTAAGKIRKHLLEVPP